MTTTVPATGHGKLNGLDYVNNDNGTHKVVCNDCGGTANASVQHSYDATTHKCVCGDVDTNKNGVCDLRETVTVVIDSTKGTGTVTINGTTVANGGSYVYDSTSNTNTIVATPGDLNGTDGSAGYVDEVKIDGTTLTGSYSGGIYTGSTALSDGQTITVTFDTAKLTLSQAEVAINGYYENKGDWDNSLAAVKGLALTNTGAYTSAGGSITDYTVVVSYSSGSTINLDDTSVGGLVNRAGFMTAVNVTDGSEGYRTTTITKAATDKIVALTATTSIKLVESREPAQVSFSSGVSGKYDTLDLFKEAVAGTINVLDNKNADCKANAGLTVTLNPVEGKVNTYTVSYSLANDGATWLATSGTFGGEVVWTVSTYTVVWYNEDGTTVLDTQVLPYGSTPVYAGDKTTEELAAAKNDAQYTWTFGGWAANDKVAEDDTITGAATYTATYTSEVNKYTVTFKNEDGTVLDTQTIEYGKGATAPTDPTKASSNTENFTFAGWDVAFDNIVKDTVVTATYTASTRYYTVTFVNEDGTELQKITNLKYEDLPEYTGATPTKAADNTYTYTFESWDKEIVKVTEDNVVYEATYTSTYIEYTITWVYNGKTEDKHYYYGDAIVAPEATDYVVGNTTYTFKGGEADGDSDAEVGETLPATVTETITYKAIYTDLTVWDVTVEFGNGDADATGKVEDGKTYTVPAAPTREGYRFMGWYVNGEKVSDDITITANTTIEAKWAELFTITWMNDGKVYKTETDMYIAGETPAAPDDPTKAADAQYTYTFSKWTPEISAITGDTTYTAEYNKTVNSYEITFTDENGNVLDEQTLEYGVMPEYKGEEPTKQYYSWAWDKAIATVTGAATYKLVWTPNNDANNNGVADELETGTVTLAQEGNGNVTLTPAGKATLLKQEGNVYTYLWDSTDAANKVINVTTSLIDTNATDGNVDYVISAPATVNIGETLTVEFGTHTLNANNGTVAINGYYESRQNQNVFDTLKADVLTAAGLTGVNAGNYTVTVNLRGNYYDLDKMTGITNIFNWETFFLAVEVPESGRQFTIKDNTTGVSKTVTMAITDSRSSAGLVDKEFTDVKVLNDQQGLSDYVNGLTNGSDVNPNGVTVSVELTEGSWPPAAAGVTTKLVYTVTYADSADYIGDSATLTVYVQSAYNNCTVVADSTLTAGGSLTVSPSNDNTTVAGNDTVTITVTPSGDNVVETITVYKNGELLATYTTDKISYSSQSATVSFNSDGTEIADAYTVEVEYSDKYLNLKADQTIVYCVDDTKHTYDLQKLVFDAIFGGSSAPMTKYNVTLEFNYWTVPVTGTKLWADVSKDPAINLDGVTHKFGESGSETIKLTYSDDKYGSFEQTVVLNVYDACYNVTVGVETVTNGANATIKTQYSEDAREYLDVTYFKAGTSLTVTLTPDGAFLDTLKQMYNGTYADSMAYIKSVTVYDKAGNVVEATLTRDQGKLSLDNILEGVNPMLYNAAVTFDLDADEAYEIVVEYGILTLEKKNDNFKMEMYKGGKDYAAKAPSAQELINAVLGETEAAAFLATYGGAYTVEFSTDLISYNWTAVSDEALLALSDGTEITVRITWKPTDGDKTYYPVATTADVTLVDLRTPTSIEGTVPTEEVEYVEQDQLIAELKAAMGLAVMADGSAIDVAYTVTYTITGDETNGFYAAVTVTYDGSADYMPTSKTFENVPIADIPDNATVKVAIQNASDVITNNDGKIQSLDPSTGIYTVIGNGTYNFKFTPVSGKAIESVTVNGEAVELSYSKGVATFSMTLTEKEHYEVVVETVDSVWVLEDERVYDFAYGYTDAVNEDIVDAAVKAPTADSIDYSNVSIEYMARAEGKVTVALPDIDLGFTVIELGSFDIDLGELWLNPKNTEKMVSEDQLDKILEDLVEDVVAKVSSGQLAANNALTYIQDYIKALPLGIHAFGANGDGSTETIRIEYADDKYTLAQVVTDVTIHDYRTKTEIVASDCTVTYGYSLEQLLAASGAVVTADGAAVSGLSIETGDLYLHAKTEAQQVTLYFAGNETYQPCELTINVTVNKASCSVDYDSQIITYGDDYDLALSVSPTVMPDGTDAKIDRIEFMIGLDMNKLLDVDLSDNNIGIDQAIAYIQLRLPQSIRELPLVGQHLQGEFTLSEFTDLINSLSDVLGIDEGSMETLNQVIEAITGVTDNMEIKIIIKDEDFHPTNIGVYIAGAVTVDSDFETAYTADYLIIVPKTTQAELAWDYTDDNMIMTLPAYQATFKDLMGAHVVETETMTGKTLEAANDHVKYLILGVNDENSEFLTTDIYGNIKANIWTSNEGINDNGAYVQIAYLINWGNEVYYAMPLIRSFLIVPGLLDVQLVGSTGEPNNDLLKEFNNQPHGFSVEVTDNEGNMIYSDHYQNLVELPEGDEYTIKYIGLQTNTNPYNSSEKPLHAGAYAVIATYMQKDESGNLTAFGMDTGILVIEPTTSTINVENVAVPYEDTNRSLADLLQIQAGSTVEGLVPDTTIITAAIAANGDFSENGWDAIDGTVNVDFPKWIDDLIAQYAPSIRNGITMGEFNSKLVNKLPELSAALQEAGISAEIADMLQQAMSYVSNALANVPDDVQLSFDPTEDITVKSVGAYLVIGVVTDSDHYPSADAGILVIYPVTTQVELKFEEDWNGNNIFTWNALQNMNLDAQAYDMGTENVNTEATEKVTNLYLGFTDDGQLLFTSDKATLDNGAYTQLAYLLDIGAEMYYAKPISRAFLIVPNPVTITFVDETGAENNERMFTFDNTSHAMNAVVTDSNGVVIEDLSGLTITYTGVQTNLGTYNSTEPPVHAGTYVVTATYSERDEQGRVVDLGVAVGAMVIVPASSDVVVNSQSIPFDGLEHSINDMVVASSVVEKITPDTTIITASINTDGSFSENLMDAIEGSINIDLPKWADDVLAEYESIYDGVTVSGMVSALQTVEEELSKLDLDVSMFTKLRTTLEQLPGDLTVTFNSDITKSAVGVYVIIGLVTDSDHMPAMDVGYLVIYPELVSVDLEFNQTDSNGFFTNELMKYFDFNATAYTKADGEVNDTATDLIQHMFIGLDYQGNIVLKGGAAAAQALPYGAYTQLAFIAHVDSVVYVAAPIVRPVIRIPNTVNVDFDDVVVSYNGKQHSIGEISITDAAGDAFEIVESALTVRYAGVSTNGQLHWSENAPIHAGVYTVMALYVDGDNVGAHVGSLIITPAKASISVPDLAVKYGSEYDINVTVTPEDETIPADDPKYLLITAGTESNLFDGEISLKAVSTINMEFPKAVADVLESLGITDGITIGDFTSRVEAIRSALAEIGYESDYLDQAIELISQFDSKLTISFTKNYKPTEVGTYFMVASIFDPDYLPAADTGVLVIYPDGKVIDIEFTLPIPGDLNIMPYNTVVDFDFSAYTDGGEEMDAQLRNVIFGLTTDGKLFLGDGNAADYAGNPNELGVYTQVAFLNPDLNVTDDGMTYVAIPEMRMFTVVKCDYSAIFVEDPNADPLVENDDRIFTYTGEPIEMPAVIVDAEGNVMDIVPTVYYMGMDTTLDATWSTTAPTNAGVYATMAYYFDEQANIYTMETGVMVIKKAEGLWGIWDTVVPFDNEEHSAFVPNEVYGPIDMDYFTVIIDKQEAIVNFRFDDDFNAKLKEVLDIELSESFTITGVDGNETVDKLIQGVQLVLSVIEGTELPESVKELINVVKVELGRLSDGYTININGALPVQSGDYEFYCIAYHPNYSMEVAQALLTIEPIRIVINDEDGQYKLFGEEEPTLTASLSYYSYEGLEQPELNPGDGTAYIVPEKVDIAELPTEVTVTYEVIREEGEALGDYAMSVINASVSDTRNYIVEVVEDDTVFSILPNTPYLDGVEITNDAEAGVEITEALSLAVPYSGSTFIDLGVALTDQHPLPYSSNGVSLSWSLEGAVEGIEIDTDGVLKVSTAAAEFISGELTVKVTVTATEGEISVSDTIDVVISREESVASTVEILDAEGNAVVDPQSVKIPEDGSNSASYTAKVYDQYGLEMSGQNITWSISPADSGVTVSEGTVSVAAGAADGVYTLTAKVSDTVSDSQSITVSKLPVWNVSCDGVKASLGDENLKLEPECADDAAPKYSFEVKSGESVTVDEDGTLTIKGTGKTVITITVAGDENHATTVLDVVVTVSGITVETLTTIYDGSGITVSGDAGSQADLIYSYTGDGVVTVQWYYEDGKVFEEAPAPFNAGTYYVGISASAGSEYAAVEEVRAKVIIEKAPAIISAEQKNLTYTGDPFTVGEEDADIIYTYTGDGKVEYTWYDASGTALDGAPMNAGDYTVVLTAAETDNYTKAEIKLGVSIGKADASIDITVNDNIVYDGNAVKIGEDITYNYTGNDSNAVVITWYDSSKQVIEKVPVNAGIYYIGIYAKASDDYNAVSEVIKEFVIQKQGCDDKPIDVSAKYGSSGTLDLGSYTVTGGTLGTPVVENADILSACEVQNGVLSYTVVNNIELIGEKAIIKIRVSPENYADYDIVITVTVTPADSVLTSIAIVEDTSSIAVPAYGENANTETFTVKGCDQYGNEVDLSNYTIDWSIYSTEEGSTGTNGITIDGGVVTVTSSAAAGKIKVHAEIKNIAPAIKEVEIVKAAPRPVVTISGADELTISATAGATSVYQIPVKDQYNGTYTVVDGMVCSDDREEFVELSKVYDDVYLLSVAKEAAKYADENGEFEIMITVTVDGVTTTKTVTVKVVKLDQTLSFAESSITKTYGDAPFTNTLSGAKTTVTYSSSDESVAKVDPDTGKVTIVGVGEATITAKAVGTALYNEATASYTITVNAAPVVKLDQTLSFAESSITKTYGDAVFTNTLTGAKTDVTYSSSDESVVTVDDNGNVTIVGVGTATITASAAATDAYNAASASYTVTVGKADLDLTVAIEGWTYGDEAKKPVVSDNTSGGAVTTEWYDANGNKLEGAPVNAGSYTVKILIAETATHAAGEATASFTIAKKAATITMEALSVAEGTEVTTDMLKYNTEGFLKADLTDGLSITAKLEGTTITAEVGGTKSGNYEITVKDAELTYIAAPVLKQIVIKGYDNAVKTYGTADFEFGYTIYVDGVEVEKLEGLVVKAEREPGEELGTYTVYITVTAVPEGYEVAEVVYGELEICQRPVVIYMDSLTVPEGTKVTSDMLTYYLNPGFLEQDTDEDGEIVITPVLDGATITAVVTGTKSGNYYVTVETGTLTYAPVIPEKQQASITVTSDDITYDGDEVTIGGENADITYSYNGDGDVEVTWYDAEGNKLNSAPVDAGSYKVVITAPETGNYTGATAEYSFTIAKAEWNGSDSAEFTVKYGSSNSEDISQLIAPDGQIGTIEIGEANILVDGSVSVADGKLNFSVVDSAALAGKSVSLKFLVVSGNYADYTVSITIKINELEKLDAPVITVTDNGDGTYTVTIEAAEGAAIYYTVDGTDPTTGSTLYTGPFTVSEDTVVKAIAAMEGKVSSEKAEEIVDIKIHTVTGTATSWDDENNTVFYLYDASVSDELIRAQWNPKADTQKVDPLYTGVGGEVKLNEDGVRYDQTFTFEDVAEGTYKLAICKEGKYVVKVIEITVSEYTELDALKLWLYGDINYDGVVLANDAAQISRYINLDESLFDLQDEDAEDRLLAADINSDGQILANDAAQISRYINFSTSIFDTLK